MVAGLAPSGCRAHGAARCRVRRARHRRCRYRVRARDRAPHPCRGSPSDPAVVRRDGLGDGDTRGQPPPGGRRTVDVSGRAGPRRRRRDHRRCRGVHLRSRLRAVGRRSTRSIPCPHRPAHPPRSERGCPHGDRPAGIRRGRRPPPGSPGGADHIRRDRPRDPAHRPGRDSARSGAG